MKWWMRDSMELPMISRTCSRDWPWPSVAMDMRAGQAMVGSATIVVLEGSSPRAAISSRRSRHWETILRDS